VKDEHHQEYHSDGHGEDKDLEVDRSEDRQVEAEDRQEEFLCLCHKRPNQEDITEIN
jgi:hypothetical protein